MIPPIQIKKNRFFGVSGSKKKANKAGYTATSHS